MLTDEINIPATVTKREGRRKDKTGEVLEHVSNVFHALQAEHSKHHLLKGSGTGEVSLMKLSAFQDEDPSNRALSGWANVGVSRLDPTARTAGRTLRSLRL